MKILLACSAGMSTSLLEKSIQDYMAANGIEGVCEAHPAEAAKRKYKEFDVLLLGPQVGYMKASFVSLVGDMPVDVIAPADYAMAKGENVYKTALKMVG